MMKLVSVLVFVFLALVCCVQCDSFVGDYLSKNRQLSLLQYDIETLQGVNFWTSPGLFNTACYMESQGLYYVLAPSNDNRYFIFSLNITSGHTGKHVLFGTEKTVVIFMKCDPVFGLAFGTVETSSSSIFTLYTVNYTTASSNVVMTRNDTEYLAGTVGLDTTTHTLYFQIFVKQSEDDSSNANGAFLFISLADKSVTVFNYFAPHLSSFDSAVYLPQTNSFVGLNVTWESQKKTKNLPFTYVQTDQGLEKRKNIEDYVFLYNLVSLSCTSSGAPFQQIGQKVKYPNNEMTSNVGTMYTSSNTLITVLWLGVRPPQLSFFSPTGKHHLSEPITYMSPRSFIQYIPDN